MTRIDDSVEMLRRSLQSVGTARTKRAVRESREGLQRAIQEFARGARTGPGMPAHGAGQRAPAGAGKEL